MSNTQLAAPVRVTGGSTQIIAAGGAGRKTLLTTLHLANAGSKKTEFILYDGSTERRRWLIYPGQHINVETLSFAMPVVPLDQMTAATAVNGAISDNVGSGGVLVEAEYRYSDTGGDA